jgi:hypothetical protein
MILRHEHDTNNGNGTQETRQKDNHEGGLITQCMVTTEGNLDSLALFESITSKLPFRLFIRKKVDNWAQCPDMSFITHPIAVFTVSVKSWIVVILTIIDPIKFRTTITMKFIDLMRERPRSKVRRWYKRQLRGLSGPDLFYS